MTPFYCTALVGETVHKCPTLTVPTRGWEYRREDTKVKSKYDSLKRVKIDRQMDRVVVIEIIWAEETFIEPSKKIARKEAVWGQPGPRNLR